MTVAKGIKPHLTEHHVDLAGIGSGGQARAGTLAGRVGDHSLDGVVGLLATGAHEAAEKVADLTLVLFTALLLGLLPLKLGQVVLNTGGAGGTGIGRGGAGTHEAGDHGSSVDGAVTLGAAESAGFGGAHLTVSHDGSVGLRATAVGGAVTRSAVGDWEKV